MADAILDKEPPQFIAGECPDDVILNIDSANNTAFVHWVVPSGSDNSGDPPVIFEVHGHEPDTRFAAGAPHLVKYTITDGAGNVGSSCEFMITIQCKGVKYFMFFKLK